MIGFILFAFFAFVVSAIVGSVYLLATNPMMYPLLQVVLSGIVGGGLVGLLFSIPIVMMNN